VTHRFHAEALEEWHAAAAYYEGLREGLGIEFIQAVRAAIEKVQQSPGAWPAFTTHSRAYRLDRFPYRLVYAILPETDEILIATVMHTSRDSRYVASRLGDTP
jgi:mRNA-degrading endonuclease RelE of RelBE toxin-antitoxin system